MIEREIQIPTFPKIWRLGVSNDGQSLAFAAGEGLYLLDLQSTEIRTIPENTNANCLLFSPNNKHLIVAGGSDNDPIQKNIRVYNTETLEKTVDIEAHDKHVRMVRYNSNHTHIVSAGVDGRVRIWNTETWACTTDFIGHTRNVQDAAFSPDDKYIISGSLEGRCRVWDFAKKEQIAVFENHLEEEEEKEKRSRVASVCFSPDGQTAVSGSYGGTIRIWNPQTTQQITKIPKQELGSVNHLTFTPDGQTLIAVHANGQVSFINTSTWYDETVIQAHTARTMGHALTPNGNTLVTGSWDKTIKVLDISSRRLTQTLHISRIHS